jgi:hypothetical protein
MKSAILLISSRPDKHGADQKVALFYNGDRRQASIIDAELKSACWSGCGQRLPVSPHVKEPGMNRRWRPRHDPRVTRLLGELAVTTCSARIVCTGRYEWLETGSA